MNLSQIQLVIKLSSLTKYAQTVMV